VKPPSITLNCRRRWGCGGSTLKKIKERLGRYLDAFMLEASKSAGKELIKQLGKFSRWWLLLDALTKLAQSVFNWLH
jgi:hypothetical protein